MSQPMTPEPVSKKRVVYSLPGMESIAPQRDLPFAGSDGNPLAMDLYLPSGHLASAVAVVVLVEGFPDQGFNRMLGCRFKEMGSTVSWAQLMAASGLAAVAYTNRQPEADLLAILDHLAAHAAALGIDADRMAVCASSGHAALALSTLLKSRGRRPRCAALVSPYLMDLDEEDAVAKASAGFGFANPSGRSIDALATDVPIFLGRSGADQMPGLNKALDQFVTAALAANLPLTVVNHPTGPHAADLFDPSEASQRVVRAALAFLENQLGWSTGEREAKS